MSDTSEALRRLGYHPVAGDAQRSVYEDNRARAIEMYNYIESIGGPSREKSLALTALQEMLMWLNAHVACNDVGVADDRS